MSKHETLTTLRQLKQFAEEAAELAKGRSRDALAVEHPPRQL
jgi:flagellar biosynthesis chaperone FliJ